MVFSNRRSSREVVIVRSSYCDIKLKHVEEIITTYMY